MSKRVYLNREGREGLFKGIKLLNDAVSSTLGPSGKQVIIKNGMEDAFATKDGVTVAKSIDHEDNLVNTGIQTLKKASIKQDEELGDGTTSATILCHEMIFRGFEDAKIVEDIIDYKSGMEKACEILLSHIDENAIFPDEKNQLELLSKVGTISANNDKEMGLAIAKAVLRAGKYGKVNLAEGIKTKDEMVTIDGFVVDLGFVDARFANDPKTGFFVVEGCNVLLLKGKLTDQNEFNEIARIYDKGINSLIIIAQDYSTDIRNSANHINQVIKGKNICLLKNNMRENEFNAIYEDLAAYSDAVITTNFEGYHQIGFVKKVTVKPGYSIFEHDVDTSDYLETLAVKLENASLQSEKDAIKKRMSRIHDGIVSYYVGGNSDIETKERFYRAQDAVNACAAALETGMVIGGGQVFLKLPVFDTNESESFSLGFINVINSSMAIAKQIIKNCSKSITIDELIEGIQDANVISYGFDFKQKKFGNMINMGILDPVKVVKNALINAVSVAATILTTECVIVEHNTSENE